MYIPAHFKENDRNELLRFIKENSFGVIVSAAGNKPSATHLPFALHVKEEEIFLLSHFAKANPHWQQLDAGNEVIVIFQGANAYISPSHYEHEVNVPTWNFAAVHAYGYPEIITGADEVLRLMFVTFDEFEPEFKDQWDMLPAKYKETLLNEITAFKIKVTRLEGKYKLSQNKTAAERMNIINSFSGDKDPLKHKLADMMKRNLDKKKSNP